eukprot:334998-Chlamydomonas_euryale.AAC.1
MAICGARCNCNQRLTFLARALAFVLKTVSHPLRSVANAVTNMVCCRLLSFRSVTDVQVTRTPRRRHELVDSDLFHNHGAECGRITARLGCGLTDGVHRECAAVAVTKSEPPHIDSCTETGRARAWDTPKRARRTERGACAALGVDVSVAASWGW